MKHSDRRFAERFDLNVPLHIRVWRSLNPGQEAASLNVSKSGVYFETDAPPVEGEWLLLRIAMPPEVTNGAATEWSCMGKVVRVEPASMCGSARGVAVRFSYYEVAASDSTLGSRPSAGWGN